MIRRLRVIGPGRAGRSLAIALRRTGWDVVGILGRADDVSAALDDTDVLVLAVPDGSIAEVAATVMPDLGPDAAVVVHLAGSLGLDVLAPHERVAALHPLVSMPSPELGAERLAAGAWFAVAGDPVAQHMVDDLGGRSFSVADADRAAYHAAAAVASNHLVALIGQVERIAASIGVPPEVYLDIAAGSLAGAGELGAAAALTGPVARGDWETVRRHLEAIDLSEREAYLAMAAAARRLVDGTGLPPGL